MNFDVTALGSAQPAAEEPAAAGAAKASRKAGKHALGFLNALGRALGNGRAASASGVATANAQASGDLQALLVRAAHEGAASKVARAGSGHATTGHAASEEVDDADAEGAGDAEAAAAKRKTKGSTSQTAKAGAQTPLDPGALLAHRLATVTPAAEQQGAHTSRDHQGARGQLRAQDASAGAASRLAKEAAEAVAGTSPTAARPLAFGAIAAASSEPSSAAPAVTRAGAAVAQLPVTNAAEHTVQGAILQSAAHLRVDTPDMGALELHLRVRAGELHVRVDGQAAPAVQAHAGELSRSLAADGLRLAALDASSSDTGTGSGTSASAGQGGGQSSTAREDADDARHLPRAPPPPTPARSSQVSTGRYHVKA